MIVCALKQCRNYHKSYLCKLMKMAEKSPPSDNPFTDVEISSWDPLKQVIGRSLCPMCNRSRKFFCYTCYVLVGIHDDKLIPTVRLPVKVDILKHPNERDGKSTAIHAKILSQEDVTIHIYPNIPTYSDSTRMLLLFPKQGALTTTEAVQLFRESSHQLPGNSDQSEAASVSSVVDPWRSLDRLVVIDSTWNQTNAILKDDRVKCLPCVKLGEAETHFWRPQRKKDVKHLATIEAIYYFFREMDQLINSRPYRGHYDNLLYFYAYQYGVIQQAKEERTAEMTL